MAEETIQCWSCGTQMTLGERSKNYGDCPQCEAEIELDDYLAKALDDNRGLRAKLRGLQGAEPVATDAFVPGSLADLLFQLGEKGIHVSGGTRGDHWSVTPCCTNPSDPDSVPVRREPEICLDMADKWMEERDSSLKKIEELTGLLEQCHDFLDPYRQTKLRRKVYEAIHEARQSDD